MIAPPRGVRVVYVARVFAAFFLVCQCGCGLGGVDGECVRKASKVRTLSPREVRFSLKNSSFIVALVGFVVGGWWLLLLNCGGKS